MINEPIKENAEEKILKAAETVFLRDGYAGSRMQDIADLAGINKALLHYYFRSKDKLFERIFEKVIGQIFPKAEEIFLSETPFCEAVCSFVEIYLNQLLKTPFLPLFVVTTMNKADGQNFVQKIPNLLNPVLFTSYSRDLQAGKIREINLLQFIISIMGMCIFAFLAKPMIMGKTGLHDKDFEDFIYQRITEIQKYIRLILLKEPL